MGAKHVNEFRLDDDLWEKISKGLLRNPDRPLKNTDKRMAYKLPPPTPALVPIETNKRPLEEQPGPSSKRNRVFITRIIRPSVVPVLIARPSTTLASPQPVIILEPHVQIPPELTTPRPPVQIPATPELTTPPMQISDLPVKIPVFQPPVQIQVTPEPTTPQPPVQFFLPDPPQPPVRIFLPDLPVVETLEQTLMDDSSINEIMSSVFGDCSQQGIQVPPSHTQEPQVLDTVPSLFGESNDLISFLGHFETGLAVEQQETPMDLTMPRLKKKVRKTTGFKVITPLDLSVYNYCLSCIYVCLESQSAYFAHANVFHHDGKPVPIELSIATIPRDGSDTQVICITLNHAGLTSKPKDFRSNFQENVRLRLVHHPLPKSVSVEYLPFYMRGKFSRLARGNRGLMVVKEAEQQKLFQELGLFVMALETLPKFKDICDGTFPNPVHEGVHEEEDISCCTMVKSYQFAKYLQQFNKLHAELSYKVTVLTQ
ncbi:hypothetical protein TNCV_1420431 [Trichonephila clavipes]|nr:hypothetical protein TNCV_1420431 [Trichonephila clavipes]